MINLTSLKKPIYTINNALPNNKLCNIACASKTAGNLFIENTEKAGYNKFLAEIKNKTGEILGFDSFGMYPEENKIFDFKMEIQQNLREKGLYLGELLRLKSIIELIENNLQKIELTSKESAVFFHSKYKFVPNIKSFTQRDYALKTISQNNNKAFKDLSLKAKEFIEELKTQLSGEENRQICKSTSTLCNEYINRILSDKNKELYKQYPFEFPIDMILTKDTIKENKTTFNKLFEKHGLDYNI